MSTSIDFFNNLYEWFYSHLGQIVFSLIAIIIAYSVYKLLTKQITRLKEQEKLEDNIAFTLNRIFQWIASLIIFAIIFANFGIQIGMIASLLALAGGTIIGFAAMNTIGNAIAGLIIMTSRPFRIGDRVFFNGKFADVISIDLVYTRMKTLDNVMVSVPNQELLNTEIDNYGKKKVVRRSCSITAGYELGFEQVENTLLEASSNVKRVLKNPKPYVRITDFKDFACEYTLYVFVNDIKRLREIDADLRRIVLATCKRQKIDLRTPILINRVDNNLEID